MIIGSEQEDHEIMCDKPTKCTAECKGISGIRILWFCGVVAACSDQNCPNSLFFVGLRAFSGCFPACLRRSSFLMNTSNNLADVKDTQGVHFP